MHSRLIRTASVAADLLIFDDGSMLQIAQLVS